MVAISKFASQFLVPLHRTSVHGPSSEGMLSPFLLKNQGLSYFGVWIGNSSAAEQPGEVSKAVGLGFHLFYADNKVKEKIGI